MSSCLALLLAVSACEGVPDLRFGGDDGAAPISEPDATLIVLDSAPGQPSNEDATISPGDDATAPVFVDDGAPGPTLPEDAATPPPPGDGAAPPPNGCPSAPPPGTICCGAVACKGTQQECNCMECAYCASQGVCCPSSHPPPGYCASSVKDCH